MPTKPPRVFATDPPRLVWLEALHDAGRKLGRTPTRKDWRTFRAPGIRSVEQYERRFGSWTDALRAAGLALNREQEFTKQELVEQLRNLATAKGRKLKPADVSTAAKQHVCAKERTFFVAFGSIPKALKAAGVYRERKLSDEKMLADLRRIAAKLAHPIRTSDIVAECRRGHCVGLFAYRQRFGSFVAAVRAAGLEYIPQAIGREELLAYLVRLHDELGRNPTYREVLEQGEQGLMPTMMNYSKKFGGVHGALVAAGLAPPPPTAEEQRAQMIDELRKLTESLGHVPISREWIAAAQTGAIRSRHLYRAVFGSIPNAIAEAGLTAFTVERAQRVFKSED
jgi:hypothetical protein